MKKLFLLILAFLYLAEASGMSLYAHYCMDHFVSWGWTKAGNKCPSCGMLKKPVNMGLCKGCCKDEQTIVKLTGDHKAEIFLWKANLLGATLPSFILSDLFVPTSAPHWLANSIHAPPIKGKVPAYLFACVFRI